MPTIHPLSDVQTNQIGERTKIWQYCVVLPNAKIGSDCNICSHCFIENDVVVGNRVTIKCGVQLWDSISIEDDVFIGPNVTFTNDPFPRSKQQPTSFARTTVKSGASIGANATILPGITIGYNSMIGAGSVVTSNVPPGAVVAGNPASIIKYVDTQNEIESPLSLQPNDNPIKIGGVGWYQLKSVQDVRGQLTIAQWDQHLPFNPKRIFFVHQVPSTKIRGGHAHRRCEQVLVAIEGQVKVVVDNGFQRQEFILDSSSNALLIPSGVWATQYGYSEDCVLAVFASHDYDELDYIRDYDQYLEFVKR